jgi:hypothetical protein
MLASAVSFIMYIRKSGIMSLNMACKEPNELQRDALGVAWKLLSLFMGGSKA